jgi:protoporphyrinogen oxidase
MRAVIHAVVLEQSGYMGGISRTVNYRGNRIDIGGHRFAEIREHVDRYENLFLAGVLDKRALWEVNTEEEYHEGREEPR